MPQIIDNLYLFALLGMNKNFVKEDFFPKDRTTYVVTFYPPTKEQQAAMDRAHERVKAHHQPVEDCAETDWQSAWDDSELQAFFQSFVKAEKEASESKKPKPNLIIACELAARRSPLFMCCFLIVYRDYKPHDAMRLVDKVRRSPADGHQTVRVYKTSLPLLRGLGGPGYEFEDDLLLSEAMNPDYEDTYPRMLIKKKDASGPTEK